MKIGEILNNGEKLLRDAQISNCFYEARLFLGFVLDRSKEWIMVHVAEDVSQKAEKDFYELLKKRISGTPLQYIIGTCGFMGNEFFVDENVLIPRADTEVWLEKVIEIAKNINASNILDLCTGSGCIAISLKKALNNVDICGVDISEGALNIARKNAEYNKSEVIFIKSDLFSELKNMKFDIIVSNPPYIPSLDIGKLAKDVLNEPIIALDGGEDGLDFYKKISKNARDFLNDNGYLVFEFGYNQSEQVIKILNENNFEVIELIKDYSGNTRAVLSKKG